MLRAADGSTGLSLIDARIGVVLACGLLLLAGLPALLTGLYVSSSGNPLSGIFTIGFALMILAAQGGSMNGLIQRQAERPGNAPSGGSIFMQFEVEMALWALAWCLMMFLLRRYRLRIRGLCVPRQLKTTFSSQMEIEEDDTPRFVLHVRPGLAGLLCAVLGWVLCRVLMQTPTSGQVIGSILLSFAIAGLSARLILPTGNVVYLLLSPLLVGFVSYAMGAIMHGSASADDLILRWQSGVITGPMFAMPIHWASAGLVGVSVGIGMAQAIDRQQLSRLRQAAGFSSDWFLMPLAALIGTIGGLVAAVFATVVDLAGNGLFHLQQSGSQTQTALLLLVIPAAGGLIVGLIQFKLTRSGVINGVPEVIESLARNKGEIKASVGANKAVTATATLASGGSAGIEGPIISIGSSLGSVIARRLRIKPEHMPALIGCGAASATAGIFNAPIAGVLFVLEVILRDFSVRTFMPIVVAAVFGTAVAQQTLELYHDEGGVGSALFVVPEAMHDYKFELPEAPAYLALGLACGLTGLVLAGSMRLSSKAWQKTPLPAWVRPAVGGLLLGGMGLLFLHYFPGTAQIREATGYEQPVFMGNGYPVIETLLDPELYSKTNIGLLLLLAVLVFKIVGTALTLGSGGSGGVIAPSLFVGAALGGLFAATLDALGIFPGATPATYALAAMAGVLAATLHCPLTAFLLVFEITQDYKVILPVMLVAIVSTTCAQFLHHDSIYTDLLRRKGIRFGQLADMTLLRRMTVADVPRTQAVSVVPSDPAQRLIDLAAVHAVNDFVVCDESGRCAGMVVGDDVRTTLVQREAVPLMIVAELMRTDLPTVRPGDTLDIVLDMFAKHEVSSLPIVDAGERVAGTITRSRLLSTYQQQLNRRG
eukprot:g11997.t1